MKSIETRWKGYRFRSRLEARWAIFFESMDIEFQYEVDGFRLSDGACYIPDFYLPKLHQWAEVKPDQPSGEEISKAVSLVRDSGKELLWLVGPPDFRHYDGIWVPSPTEFATETYCLDIYSDERLFRYYSVENRLFSGADWEISERTASQRFRESIYDSRGCRFEAGTK